MFWDFILIPLSGGHTFPRVFYSRYFMFIRGLVLSHQGISPRVTVILDLCQGISPREQPPDFGDVVRRRLVV